MVFLYVTCKSQDEARKISHELISRKAAGWVNISPIQSFYRDNDEVKEREGNALLIKTIESKVQAVEDIVREVHTSKIPCIASLSLYRMNKEYKDWLISKVG